MGNKQARARHRALQRPNDPARLKRDLLKELRFSQEQLYYAVQALRDSGQVVLVMYHSRALEYIALRARVRHKKEWKGYFSSCDENRMPSIKSVHRRTDHAGFFVSDEEDEEPGVNWRAFAYAAPDASESVAHHEPDPPSTTCAEYFCGEA
jgi:hypothetical protein